MLRATYLTLSVQITNLASLLDLRYLNSIFPIKPSLDLLDFGARQSSTNKESTFVTRNSQVKTPKH